MKRCLDGGKLMDALKHASNMISELRTSLLSPKHYYELYIAAFDQLRHLESYLFDERQKGRRMGELYELVQYAGNIVPRLYLLITVGSVYIRTQEAPAKDVLRDLVEMCRGVQHPTRGLFLRNYLSEMTKDKLPDKGSEYEGRGGSVQDSIDFILSNFTEMNKLWVRMQHSGVGRDKDKRQNERDELRLLVGKNLARLSQLDGIDAALYASSVLPSVLEQIVNCKDQIAQQYLMECVIQVFPDEFHLRTLEVLLGTCSQLHASVDVKAIIVSLIDRLANFALKNATAIPPELQIVDIFNANVSKVLEARPAMPVDEQVQLYVALLNLSLKAYPTLLPQADAILGQAADMLAKRAQTELSATNVVKHITRLLNAPLESYKNVITVLKLDNYQRVFGGLSLPLRKKISTEIVKNAIENATRMPDASVANKFFEWIAAIVRDESPEGGSTGSSGNTAGAEMDADELREEQQLVARVVHLLDTADVEQFYQSLLVARKHFGQGGVRRLKYTLPPLVFRSLVLAHRLRAMDRAAEELAAVQRKVFKFAHDTMTALARANEGAPDVTLALYLQCAQAADACSFETIAYEFVTQAFVIYEGEISDSRAQFSAIMLIIGTLQKMRGWSDEQYDTLITKCAVHSAKLLKKPDQARAVYTCAHLFWTGGAKPYRDARRVLECLQKALKTAALCMDSSVNVNLYVEILNQCLYFFGKADTVTPQFMAGLVQLIQTQFGNLEQPNSAEALAVKTHFQQTLRHLRKRKETEPLLKDVDV